MPSGCAAKEEELARSRQAEQYCSIQIEEAGVRLRIGLGGQTIVDTKRAST